MGGTVQDKNIIEAYLGNVNITCYDNGIVTVNVELQLIVSNATLTTIREIQAGNRRVKITIEQ